MIIRTQERGEKAVYYQLCLSANETHKWAHRPNASWPCSQIAGHRLRISVDQNGLFDLAIDGKFKDINNDELSAIVVDFLPDNCKHLWPCWKN